MHPLRSGLLIAMTFASALACGGSSTPSANAPTNSDVPSVPKGPDKPESEKVTWKKDASAKNCHLSEKKGAGDLVANVTAMANGCVDTGKMKAIGSPTTGEGAGQSGQMVKTIPLQAQANHCYRVFGLAEESVKDMDIAVMDSTGKSAGEDSTDSNESIVLEQGNICFTADDAVSVNVAIAEGQGKYAVVIYGD